MVTITHPYHPLRGQQVEVIRLRRGSDPDLIVRLPDGLHVTIAMSGTDYTGAPDPDLPISVPPLLAIEGLRQVVQFIDHIRPEGGDAIPEEGAP